ncbi:MAG: DUF4276 family protein [Pirellulaceae bacterium]
MIRLYLTVEGQTEAEFAKNVLRPHLLNHGIHLAGARFTGLHRRRRGRIPQGGILGTFRHALADMKTWMRDDRSSDARFSMMVDLYGLPSDVPGRDEALRKSTGAEQAMALETALLKEMGDSRFIPYYQVYEFEALVLTEPAQLGEVYEIPSGRLEALRKACNRYEGPEEINHGEHSHPKARIKHVVPEYDENVAGPLIAGEIGLGVLRQACPHFGDWLHRLERLGQAMD